MDRKTAKDIACVSSFFAIDYTSLLILNLITPGKKTGLLGFVKCLFLNFTTCLPISMAINDAIHAKQEYTIDTLIDTYLYLEKAIKEKIG